MKRGLDKRMEQQLLGMIHKRAQKREHLLQQVGELREEIGVLYMAGHDKRVPVQKMADAAGVRRETVYHWLDKQNILVDLEQLMKLEEELR
jgi:predicted transcriptional regulator